LPRHVEVFAELVERAAVMRMQQIQQLAPVGIRQGLEQQVRIVALCHVLHARNEWFDNMQVFTCMSSDDPRSAIGPATEQPP